MSRPPELPSDPTPPPNQAWWEDERARLAAELGCTITLDGLTGPVGLPSALQRRDDAGGAAAWLVAQRKSGHRHSIDDVLTAWFALRHGPRVPEHLDLGTGIGTVGLLTLWGQGSAARLTCVEAQDVSFRLLRTNIEGNGLGTRVEPHHGDLRDLALGRRFALVTGSPPYFPASAGVLPQDSQKAHARFELRGDVADYARAAARHLTPDGWFALCFPTPQRQRAFEGVAAAGLRIVCWQDVVPRASLPALFTLIACRPSGAVQAEPREEPPFVVREQNGRLTAAMAAVRRGFGFADGPAHGDHGPAAG